MRRMLFLLLAAFVAACDAPSPPPAPARVDSTGEPVAAAPAAPAPAHDSGMKDMLLGGAIGYLLGSSTAPKQPTVVAPVVVNRTVVIERKAPVKAAPAPAPAPAAAKVVPVTPPAAPPKPSYAPPQPYVVKQSPPTYTAPPKPYTPPAPSPAPSGRR